MAFVNRSEQQLGYWFKTPGPFLHSMGRWGGGGLGNHPGLGPHQSSVSLRLHFPTDQGEDAHPKELERSI